MPKARLTSLDILALSTELQSLVSLRLQNIYGTSSCPWKLALNSTGEVLLAVTHFFRCQFTDVPSEVWASRYQTKCHCGIRVQITFNHLFSREIFFPVSLRRKSIHATSSRSFLTVLAPKVPENKKTHKFISNWDGQNTSHVIHK